MISKDLLELIECSVPGPGYHAPNAERPTEVLPSTYRADWLKGQRETDYLREYEARLRAEHRDIVCGRIKKAMRKWPETVQEIAKRAEMSPTVVGRMLVFMVKRGQCQRGDLMRFGNQRVATYFCVDGAESGSGKAKRRATRAQS